MSDNANKLVELRGDEKDSLVERKATCPFLGSAVAEGELGVRNDANNPLTSIDDVKGLGNTGGGHLGVVLAVFASGNHAFMRGESGKLDEPVPIGLFSLELPGSQGSHPGHSGILEGDPEMPGSGRLSEEKYAGLTDRAVDGWIKRSDVGRFIAKNMLDDPDSTVSLRDSFGPLARDLGELVKASGSALVSTLFRSREDARTARRNVGIKFTKLLGENNLIGSAGEFGLLFAFLAHKPGAKKVGGEPAVAVEDLEAMFVDKRLPDGWKTWKKTIIDWLVNTFVLWLSAGREYRTLRRAR